MSGFTIDRGENFIDIVTMSLKEADTLLVESSGMSQSTFFLRRLCRERFVGLGCLVMFLLVLLYFFFKGHILEFLSRFECLLGGTYLPFDLEFVITAAARFMRLI
jgi:hypothetical protein